MSKDNILLLLDTARKNIFASQVKIEQLEKENAELREVLGFYANEENYKLQDYKGLHNFKPIGDEHRFFSDHGDKARKILAKYKGE